MADLLGEQLLTEVNALVKTALLPARLSRCGAFTSGFPSAPICSEVININQRETLTTHLQPGIVSNNQQDIFTLSTAKHGENDQIEEHPRPQIPPQTNDWSLQTGMLNVYKYLAFVLAIQHSSNKYQTIWNYKSMCRV